MPSNLQTRTLLPLLIAASTLACPGKRLDFGPDGEANSPGELLRRVAVAESQVLSVKGEAKLKVATPRGAASAGLFVGVMHPAFVHLEALDFFGRPQVLLVTDGERFSLYDAQASKFYRGPASPTNLARVLPIVLPPPELTALLLGRAPRLDADSSELSFDRDAGLYRLTLHRGALTQRLEVQPPEYRVVHSAFSDTSAYEVWFDSFLNTPTASFPQHAVMASQATQTRIELTYKELELNPPVDLTLFEALPPDHVPEVEVDAYGVEQRDGGPR